MAEERKISAGEIRRTIATSLGAAFGFVIGLLWSNVVLFGISTAGINLSPTGAGVGNWGNWGYFVVTAVVITLVMVVLIVVVGRWGGKD